MLYGGFRGYFCINARFCRMNEQDPQREPDDQTGKQATEQIDQRGACCEGFKGAPPKFMNTLRKRSWVQDPNGRDCKPDRTIGTSSTCDEGNGDEKRGTRNKPGENPQFPEGQRAFAAKIPHTGSYQDFCPFSTPVFGTLSLETSSEFQGGERLTHRYLSAVSGAPSKRNLFF